jgi:hypothetical protein
MFTEWEMMSAYQPFYGEFLTHYFGNSKELYNIAFYWSTTGDFYDKKVGPYYRKENDYYMTIFRPYKFYDELSCSNGVLTYLSSPIMKQRDGTFRSPCDYTANECLQTDIRFYSSTKAWMSANKRLNTATTFSHEEYRTNSDLKFDSEVTLTNKE